MARLKVRKGVNVKFFFTRFSRLVSYVNGKVVDVQEPGKAMFLGETVPTGTPIVKHIRPGVWLPKDDGRTTEYGTTARRILYDGEDTIIFPDYNEQITVSGHDKIAFDKAVKKFMKKEELDGRI